MNDDNLLDDDEPQGQDEAEAEAPQEEGPAEDSDGTAVDPDSAWAPSAKLLGKLGELLKTRRQLEEIRAQKKASNAAYADREKALDSHIGELTEQINAETWHEEYDEEEGIVNRTNRLTGETETRPYTPPPQTEIPFLDERLRGVEIGMFGEDPEGNAYRVEALAAYSVVLRYYDDGSRRVPVADWSEYAPREDVGQSDYREAFNEEQASWTSTVLEAIDEAGSTVEQVTDALLLSPEEHEGRVAAALGRLVEAKALRESDGVYLLQDPDAAEEDEAVASESGSTDILEAVTEQWEGIGAIATRAGLESKAAARQIKRLLEAGRVEAEGEKRGRKYRIVG